MTAGLGLVLWGRSGAGQRPPGFAIERGSVNCGELLAETGGTDLLLRAFAGNSQLVVGEFPRVEGPRVEVNGTGARVTVAQHLAAAHLATGPWNVALAKGMPWELDLRAGGGHLDANLRDLTVASLRLHSAFGNVALTLPAQGPGEMQLRLGLGDLLVSVPEGLEVRLRLVAGPLVKATVDERRFINVAPGEWMTPLYPTTAQRCTVQVNMAAGDLRVA